MPLTIFSLPAAVGALVGAAAVIALFGSRLVGVVEELADRTRLGEAIAGAVLLGGATSLSGLVVSVVAATAGEPSVAISNSVGGIAAQTTFVVVLDLVYRRVNLEHAAASLTNLFTALLMVTLLGTVVIGIATPPVTLLGVHPASLLLVFVYGYGLHISKAVTDHPMWQPEDTAETSDDTPQPAATERSLGSVWARFAVLGLVVAGAGWVVGGAGLAMIEGTGLSGTFIAVVVTAVVTSLPELVTGVAAVRAGALNLAVGGIIGGNTFDTLFIAAADAVYQPGSLYAAILPSDVFVLGWTILLTGILGAGLVRRERRRIGFEGIAILVLYVGGVLVLLTLN